MTGGLSVPFDLDGVVLDLWEVIEDTVEGTPCPHVNSIGVGVGKTSIDWLALPIVQGDDYLGEVDPACTPV